ncbi:multiple sugar transport system substrate-binding protein [Kaistia hirudinis]|uniref:Multiple sugar transport system substrate-binding protein n=1 Tax=Kaistia hirudinis TaxID=1293440 RepID=A0A840ARU8_9HYPH|nr:sugar ABC transporter substrate-binding protein [Kaistia hirudinis]MBB3932979.1 multiple sugar transport system substrate-binding protein [Kaistia hirudinis]
MTKLNSTARRLGAALLLSTGLAGAAFAADKPLDGVTLTIASQNDQFAAVIAKLAPQFEEKTGATVKVDILDYGSLLTKTQADFVGHTKSYDMVTMDIVWAGQYADNGYSVDLTDWIKRDAAELQIDDIYPAALKYIGQYDGKQVAFPFAGYAAVMAYRKDLLDAAGIKVPETAEDFVEAAIKLTDPSKKIYGFVANGQKGAAVAQDWLQYNAQLGGSVLNAEGKPVLNSDANIASLKVYKELFDKAAPPGAVDYDWGGREESFRQGLVAMMETWSVGAPGYYDPSMSNIVDSVAITYTPVGKGLPPKFGFGGWGLAINNDIDEKKKEASWEFIKWLVSPPVHKEMNMLGAGSYIRKSTLADPELNAKYPFLPIIAKSFENADGDYRPRIPQYPEIQDLLGTAVNAVLVGGADPKAALDEAQKQAEKLF